MSNVTRVPKDEAGFNVWYPVFSHNLPSVAADLGVSAAEQARVDNDSQLFPYLIARNNIIRAYKEDESKVKNRAFGGEFDDVAPKLPTLDLPPLPVGVTMSAGIQDYAEMLVQRIVKSTGFNVEIEALLGIEVKGGEGGDDVLRTDIKEIIAELGAIVIKASLKGRKAYRVFCQRGNSADFETIGDSTQAEFTDDRPNLVAGQPEKRQYKIILLENNKPAGEYSATETIVTQP